MWWWRRPGHVVHSATVPVTEQHYVVVEARPCGAQCNCTGDRAALCGGGGPAMWCTVQLYRRQSNTMWWWRPGHVVHSATVPATEQHYVVEEARLCGAQCNCTCNRAALCGGGGPAMWCTVQLYR